MYLSIVTSVVDREKHVLGLVGPDRRFGRSCDGTLRVWPVLVSYSVRAMYVSGLWTTSCITFVD